MVTETSVAGENSRFFLEGHCRTLRTLCCLGGWCDGEGGDLAARVCQKMRMMEYMQGIPEAEEVSYFLLARIVSNILDLEEDVSLELGAWQRRQART